MASKPAHDPAGYRISAGACYPLGVTCDADGVNVALFSAHAERVEFCLFDSTGQWELARIPLPHHTDQVWHGHIAGVRDGALYGFRVHGPYAPDAGHRFNANKLLLDPYAREVAGSLQWSDVLYGYRVGSGAGDVTFDRRDSARAMPKCRVVADLEPTPAARWQRVDWSRTVIYEVHLRGHTMLHPDVPRSLRGSFAGFARPEVIRHLRTLGVTAVEFLPIQFFVDEPHLVAKSLRNYWGYNTIGFFAPHPGYLAGGRAAEVRTLVDRLHDAGIEVILDVVYNHSGEGDALGPTLSFRGIDNASYYVLDPRDPRRYVNHAGTGNVLNLANPRVLQMVMDSLRYWAVAFGVDGFRFDLTSCLARDKTGAFDPDGAFLATIRQDPVLNRCKLIAEPWDLGPGGYRLGGFPPGWAEWNDRFRDVVRRFWRGDRGQGREFTVRFDGSPDLYAAQGRKSWASVNAVTTHDGFTLLDLVSYATKHNDANGEGNRDGHNENYSDNAGIEGPSDDVEICAGRDRRRRALLATLVLAKGTPLILAGDEVGRTQSGNNNAYCQDGPLAWTRWPSGSDEKNGLTRYIRRCLAIRRLLLAGQHGRDEPRSGLGGGGEPDEQRTWFGTDGRAIMPDASDCRGDPTGMGVLIRRLGPSPDGDRCHWVAILFNPTPVTIAFAYPRSVPPLDWRLLIDTSRTCGRPEDRVLSAWTEIAVSPGTLLVLAAVRIGG